MKKRRFGVVYFLDRNPAFEKMLEISMQSLRRFHPDWPIEVMHCPSFTIPAWKKAYRLLSFWKWRERRARCNQDWRVIYTKATGMINTPFEHTLYLDVDTVVMKSLAPLRERAEQCDAAAAPLTWKYYDAFEAWQPRRIPMIMAGVVFYNSRFIELYRPYLERLKHGAGRHFSGDQYMFSAAWALESANARLELMPELQIDTMNLEQHLGTSDFPRIGDVLDLKYRALKRFYVFHYNGPHKQQYLGQIKAVWGLPMRPAPSYFMSRSV